MLPDQSPGWWVELGSWMCRLRLGLQDLLRLVVATSRGSLTASCWDAGCYLVTLALALLVQ